MLNLMQLYPNVLIYLGSMNTAKAICASIFIWEIALYFEILFSAVLLSEDVFNICVVESL